jgi:hypothetical protein
LNKKANEFHQISELKNENPILFQMVKNILAKFGIIQAKLLLIAGLKQVYSYA